jgi:hypothetical protein
MRQGCSKIISPVSKHVRGSHADRQSEVVS